MRSQGLVKAEQQELFPKRPYEQPEKPVEYPERPEELAPEELKWLNSLDDRLWRPCAPDRFGRVTYVDDGGKLSKEEMDRVFSVIRRCKLLTTMGSGMFGLSGYSMGIWAHSVSPGLPPKPLATITDKHLPEPSQEDFPGFEDRGARTARDEQAWLLFSQFTHSPVNRQMLALYKDADEHHRLEAPRNRSHYDY